MNKIFAFWGLILLLSTELQADINLKAVYHFEARYHHGSMQSDYGLAYEWWISKDRISLFRQEYRNYEDYVLEPAIRLTYDKGLGRIIVVNYSDSIYAVVPMKGSMDDFCDSTLVDALQFYRANGTIRQTGETTTIDQKLCNIFEVNEELYYGDNRFYDRQRIIKMTVDVPFDWRLVEEMFQWIRAFFNPEPGLLDELQKMHGFIYAAEDVRFSRGEQIKSTFNVIEIYQKDAPENIYEPPVKLKKLKQLNQDVVIPLRRIIYQIGG